MINLSLCSEDLVLLSEKVLLLPSHQTLVIADVHLGKTAHFRKEGIPAPNVVSSNDLNKISNLIERLSPSLTIFAGDLFHSKENSELEMVNDWFKQQPCDFALAIGNHDIYTVTQFKEMGIPSEVFFEIGNCIICHDVNDFKEEKHRLVIGGHIHPGVRLIGQAKQSVRLPCFYIKENRLILPSFGSFTGLHTLDSAPSCSIFGIVDSNLITITNNNKYIEIHTA